MVVDSSALVAIVLAEPEAGLFESMLQAAAPAVISTATLVEAGIVVESRRPGAGSKLDAFVSDLLLEVSPLTRAQADLAREAFARFGKGRHPAALNFGDCFVYALAKERGLPILCKGNDFARTDLPVLPAPPNTPAPGSSP